MIDRYEKQTLAMRQADMMTRQQHSADVTETCERVLEPVRREKARLSAEAFGKFVDEAEKVLVEVVNLRKIAEMHGQAAAFGLIECLFSLAVKDLQWQQQKKDKSEREHNLEMEALGRSLS